MKTLRINRAKWRCGKNHYNWHGQGTTMLLNKEGFMCCLGFRCRLSGATSHDLLNTCTPEAMARHRPLLLVKDGYATLFTRRAIFINDGDMTRNTRECRLSTLAAEHGEVWEFYGKYDG